MAIDDGGEVAVDCLIWEYCIACLFVCADEDVVRLDVPVDDAI